MPFYRLKVYFCINTKHIRKRKYGFLEHTSHVLGVFVLYHLLRFFFRIVLPVIIQVRAMRKAQQNFYRRTGGPDPNYRPGAPEGQVTVDRMPKDEKKIIKDDMGETVDFEEVD